MTRADIPDTGDVRYVSDVGPRVRGGWAADSGDIPVVSDVDDVRAVWAADIS